MTQSRDPDNFNIPDKMLLLIIILLVAATAWNSRYSILPTPEGYVRYVDNGITIFQPDLLHIWEVAIYPDARIVQDGSLSICEEYGTVGWNSGNTDEYKPPTHYWRESSITWLKSDPPTGDQLYLFYTALETNAVRNQRGLNLTQGIPQKLSYRGDDLILAHYNYTIQNFGSDSISQTYGIVAGFYCRNTGRWIELYYMDIYDFEPKYDPDSLYETFMFYLDSLHSY